MKKNYLSFIFLLVCSSLAMAQKSPLDWPQCRNTSGSAPEQPANIYLGDNALFGCDSWATCNTNWPRWRVVIKTASDIGNGGLNGTYSDYLSVEHKTATSPRFTLTGTWYWGIEVDYGGNPIAWYCHNSGAWENMYGVPTSDLIVTVSALNNPSNQTAIQNNTNPQSKIDLTWVKDPQNHNVMIVRKKSNEAWTEPTQGSSYNVGTSLGSGLVIYNNSGINFTDENLSSSTGYDYKFYSENYSYYSEGVTASASTASDPNNLFRSKANGNWNSISSWESSSDNTHWVNATSFPTHFCSSVSISDQITVTAAETGNAVTINSGGLLIISPNHSLTVTESLINSDPSRLVVQADNSGYGSLALDVNANTTQATVESYISGGRWHFISSPVSDAQSGMFTGHYLQKHNESTNAYTDVTSLSEPLTAMKGFALWGDASGFTTQYVGQLNTLSQSINLTRSGSGNNYGWNLVGNPYPCSIDWDAVNGWTKTNINNAIYIENNGGWATYIDNAGANGGSHFIAPGQGFFVNVTEGQSTGTLGMDGNARVHVPVPFLKSANTFDFVRLQVSGNNYTDEAIVRFMQDVTNEFDGQHDAIKLFGYINESAQIYTLGSGPMTINSMLPETNVVPLGIRANTPGTYTIAATEFNIPVTAIEDTKTGIFTDLISGSYTFTLEPGDNELRFMLHFGTTSVPENEKSISNIYSYQQTVYVNLTDNTQGDIYIYNLAGQLVTTKESASGNVRIGLTSTGVYMVKVITEKETLTQKVVIR